MQNKYLKFLIVVLAVAVIVPQIALAAWWNPFSWGIWNRIFHFQRTEQKQEQQNNPPIVGGDKDAHGCIGSAGYSWCQAKQKCLRVWEESCEISGDVYPIFSGPKWGNAVAKTINEPVTDVEIKGYEITAQGKINQNQDAYKFVDFYDKKLKKAGWAAANNFAADGIKGSQVGYKKGNNYIVLSYNITPGKITSGENEPLQWTCPCDVTYTIFTTTPTNPTADWKTYTNDDMGYEIKYPSGIENVKHEKEKLGIIDALHFYKLNNDIYNNAIYSFDIIVSTLGGAKTVDQIINSQFLNVETSDFLVDGMKGKKVSLENGFDGFIIKDRLEYRFHCTKAESNRVDYDCSTFNEMLSTFKLIDNRKECKKENEPCGYSFGELIGDCCEELTCKTESNIPDAGAKCVKKTADDSTAGWETYTNNEYGFELKYPSNWHTKTRGRGEVGNSSLISLDIDKNLPVSIYAPIFMRIIVENENFVLGTRDWNDFQLGKINGSIAYSGGGYEIVFVSSHGQRFYILTENNPEADATTKSVLSTFKFTK